MPASAELVDRSGDLKGDLIDYALGRRFAKTYGKAFDQHFADFDVVDEVALADFLDWFVTEHHPPGGRTIVEQFVTEHPRLTAAEREMLLGWRDSLHGIFEVQGREGEALITLNLIDEMTYRIRSNMGVAAFRPMRPGSFVITRLAPIADEWLLSGFSTLLPAGSRTEAYRIAAGMAAQFPELAFRNPEKLEQAWEQQRQERRHFIDFFGTDLVVLPGRELKLRMRAYAHYRHYEARDAEGLTAAEQAKKVYGAEFQPVAIALPDELTEAATVALIFDESEGLGMVRDYGLVEATFADPALATRRGHREVVLHYLKDRSVSPLPLRRLAERDPERASQVFQRVLKQPRFSWERDGESLLRRYKSSYFTQQPLPSVSVVSEALSRASLAPPAPPQPQPERRKRRWLR